MIQLVPKLHSDVVGSQVNPQVGRILKKCCGRVVGVLGFRIIGSWGLEVQGFGYLGLMV